MTSPPTLISKMSDAAARPAADLLSVSSSCKILSRFESSPQYSRPEVST
eukprot:CAMPEP_0115312244 /NCGR_PEP_ID=MMETSP0270-20121206/75784_1 /TAXON_ID=71861 /ORGANISM="Scrippsiella trochoidea, Strain CCMP3099" /LENGTH=48 /DNA_ID= /DNA_START= /DNA_END= /DNA_ORIENTATION=